MHSFLYENTAVLYAAMLRMCFRRLSNQKCREIASDFKNLLFHCIFIKSLKFWGFSYGFIVLFRAILTTVRSRRSLPEKDGM